MAEEGVHLDSDVEIVPAAMHATAIEQRGKGAMRWTSAMSRFALCRMCELISSGVRTDKGFKEVHLNQVAKSLQEFTGTKVTGIQVYNHLRKWRQRWMRVSKLRELSGANWDAEMCMITLEDKHYKGHIKSHPKDAEYLNKPIDMLIISGNGLATGKYAMESNEPLGNPFADSGSSVFKYETFDEEKTIKVVEGIAKAMGEASKEATSDGPPPPKRRRTVLTEEDSASLASMTDAVKDVAAAIRETKVEVLNPELCGAVMYMPGFTSRGSDLCILSSGGQQGSG
ncbi:hypothetical protein QOZ80_3BG0273250 [Eleusine coracana subsp. coracana]|nr:hypothetical protein QOZ80_3BG0273250 [Eleusine coracana subsp. coracana]